MNFHCVYGHLGVKVVEVYLIVKIEAFIFLYRESQIVTGCYTYTIQFPYPFFFLLLSFFSHNIFEKIFKFRFLIRFCVYGVRAAGTSQYVNNIFMASLTSKFIYVKSCDIDF